MLKHLKRKGGYNLQKETKFKWLLATGDCKLGSNIFKALLRKCMHTNINFNNIKEHSKTKISPTKIFKWNCTVIR